MKDWETELRNLNAREDAINRRAIAEYERKRRERKRLAAFGGIVLALAAVVALTVALTGGGGGESGGGKDGEHGVGGWFGGREDDNEPPELPDWITEDLLPVNEYSRPGTALEKVNGVVVHYVGNPGTTAQQNRNYFASLAKTHETSASSHFVIGLEGEVIQCVPLDEICYCSNSRNSDTIAIECCHPDADGKFTDETYDSLVKLLKWLCDAYDLDRDDVIRHYDVTGKICPKYFVDNPDEWEALKDDVFEDGK